ncbi:tRNA lysidine(34) synthetase TilS [Methylomonas sp. MgM2]
MLNFESIARYIPQTSGKIYIGYSGGIDSQVLLHLCAQHPLLRGKIVAVYVDHGLQAAASDWGEHCRLQAQLFGVPFRRIKVDATPKNGESPEAAARNARYQALRPLLQSEDLLLLAQHREDQLETVLLQLFRGAGVQGLAAMPTSCGFGLGKMMRPLLDTPKADIQAYAQLHELEWVEDPSNCTHDFDRNYLRHAVIPLLKQRWPSLDKTVARSAAHCGEAASLLDDWGRQMLSQLADPGSKTLALDKLSGFSDAQRNWLIRLWLQSFGLKPPSLALLQNIKKQLIETGPDADPHISIQGRVLKKYRHQLYCLTPNCLLKPASEYMWPQAQLTVLLTNGYTLTRVSSSSGIDQRLWHSGKITLKPRHGGEKIKLPGRDGHHCLKKLYQEAAVPPWERDARPLLYLDGRLAAVPGLCIAEWAYTPSPAICYSLTWQPAENM